tara:strand:- start:119 stop:541 length:423 start_codon:yes stop_codon:yes gene_type:complete
MTLKKITESKLRKLVLKSIKKDFFINEIDLVITDDPKDKKSYNEKIKFMYIGSAKIYRRKKNLKKYTNTWEDYHDEEIVYKWLEDKHKQEKGDIVYIQGLIKFKNDSLFKNGWKVSFLQICDNKEIAFKCNDGLMIYEMI